MEAITVRALTFTYPGQAVPALRSVDLSVAPGEFLVLCGPSGCGKSTLLRQFKTALAPHGTCSGEVLIGGQPLGSLDLRAQTARIGFVLQSPENQLVTDKVWHELAFGLESLGAEQSEIRRRVAEMTSFFGMEDWFYRNVADLSGGQKQLLNLAAVMTMQPELLILDEPTSQLDPIAASDFLAVLGRINRELGTTVLLTEHRLEEALPLATRVAVMDEGTIRCVGSAEEVGARLRAEGDGMFLSMPTAMRVWAAARGEGVCPVTVRDGRAWIQAHAERHPLRALPDPPPPPSGASVITAEELWFRYERGEPDVVRGLSLTVRRGELLALLGGNGAGKSTVLRLLAGLRRPYRGSLHTEGRIAMLPQNPQALFVKKTVRDDLLDGLGDAPSDGGLLTRVIRLCRLEALLDRHPYDLSGGEQQRAALAKVLLTEPEILLLDEPTKGIDAEYKQQLGDILQTLVRAGRTVVMVSHDIEFCARYAHRCALFFDGSVAAEGAPRAFFAGNGFYTTAANRMARTLLPDAVTAEELAYACGAELPAAALPSGDEAAAPSVPDPAAVPQTRLSRARRLLAAAAGIGALVTLICILRGTDLSAVLTAGGITTLAAGEFRRYALLIAFLAVLAGALGRRGTHTAPSAAVRRQTSRRTAAAVLCLLAAVPLTLFLGERLLHGQKYYFIALLILFECMTPFFLIFEQRKPQARELVLIAVLCALGVAGRAAFFMLPSFKPVIAVTVISGIAFGGETGFLVGATTMLVSNMLFAQGPWTPWQMFAMGLIGLLAGICFRRGLRPGRAAMAVFGALCAIIVYGGIMNPAAALIWARTLDPRVLLSYYLAGFPVDCIHAASTALFLWFGGEPMLEKLDRIRQKYGLTL